MSNLNLQHFVFLGIAGLLLGCGSTQPKSARVMQDELDGAPKWAKGACEAGLPNKKAICGAAAVAAMTDISLARSAAEGRARTALARNLQVHLRAILRDYKAGTSAGAEAQSATEQHIRDAAEQVTETTLSGTRLEDTWISNAGTFWALVVLDTESFKDSVQNMRQLDEAMRTAIIERADKSFAELHAATSP